MAAIQAKGGVAITFQADITKASAVEELFTAANERFGGIDILVNNAALDDFVPLKQITEEHFHSHFEVNVLGMLLAVKEAVKYMEKNHGCILNISSLSSTHPAAGSAVYGGSKAAVDAITATLALELGPNGIRVNAINPGMVKTEGLDELGFITPEFRNQIAAMTPLVLLRRSAICTRPALRSMPVTLPVNPLRRAIARAATPVPHPMSSMVLATSIFIASRYSVSMA